jgi:predicted NBD/HSP70 family sugar kinase
MGRNGSSVGPFGGEEQERLGRAAAHTIRKTWEELGMYYIGIDLGGTNVAAGVTDKEGRLLGKASIPCPRGAEAIADAMAESVRLAVHEAGPVRFGGCGIPGDHRPGKGHRVPRL